MQTAGQQPLKQVSGVAAEQYYGLPVQRFAFIEKLPAQMCNTLRTFWAEEARMQAQQAPLTLMEHVPAVYASVNMRWQAAGNALISGAVKFKDFLAIFHTFECDVVRPELEAFERSVRLAQTVSISGCSEFRIDICRFFVRLFNLFRVSFKDK